MRAVRPRSAISRSIASGGSSWPCSVPAARVMLSFINVPPRSLAPALRQAAAPRRRASPTTPGCWDVRMQHQPRRPHASAPSRARSGPARAALERDRRLHGTNGSGTNSVKPPVSLLQVADAQQVARPVLRPVDMAEHDGRGRCAGRRRARLARWRAMRRSRPCRGRGWRAPRRRGFRPRCRAGCRGPRRAARSR